MSLPTLSAGLLIAGGLINAVPPVGDMLKKIAGGRPIFQIFIGAISTVIGLALVAKLF